MISSIDATELTVTAPVNPVHIGRILSIHCHIRDIVPKQKVTISRIIDEDEEQVISVDKTLLLDEEDTDTAGRTFIAERQLGDGSTVFFLSIIEVKKEDGGEYWCKVKSSNFEEIIAKESTIVNLNYFPDDTSPTCYGDQIPNLVEGIPFNFNCTSERGNPTVDITWTRGDIVIKKETAMESPDGSMVYSNLYFTPQLSDEGALLLCKVTSSSFPEKSQQCHIGPLKVRANPNAPKNPTVPRLPTDSLSPTFNQGDANEKTDEEDSMKSTRPSANCQEACSAFSTPVFYWVLGTIIAGIIAIVFLITGIVLYIRYCKMVAQGKERRFVYRQSPEDVYEKLEYRKNDKTLYMSLDKHAIKGTDLTQQQGLGGVYGQPQPTEGVHYNMTPTHIRPPQLT